MNESTHDPPGTAADEARLVAAMKAGDEEAFAATVRAYGPRMLAVARRFLGHEQDAQDAVQDAFLNAFRAIDSFEEQSRLATWLHRIVVNAALAKIRSRQRRNEQNLDDLLPRFHEDGARAGAVHAWAATGETAAADRETRALVRSSIDRLPDTDRTILLLRDIEGFTTDEAAATLGITPGAAKVRLHRARQALRNLLDPHLREKAR